MPRPISYDLFGGIGSPRNFFFTYLERYLRVPMLEPNRTALMQFKGNQVLVVGGQGFIGRRLVARLFDHGAKVTSLGLKSEKQVQYGKDFTLLAVDLSDPFFLEKSLKGKKFDYVFNLGGYIDHSRYFSTGGRRIVNCHYTAVLNLLDNIYHADLQRFIQVGSSDEYGDAPAPQKESQREGPISCYSAAKAGITHLIQALSRAEKFPGVIVRFFLVYGPGQNEQRFLPQLILGCLADRNFPVSEGRQLRDFCYVDDAVDGLIASALTRNANGEVINIASGNAVSIREIIEKVANLIGSGRPEFGGHPYRPSENMAVYANIGLARSILNWRPVTSLDEGLKKTIEWYQRDFKS